jgi:hypothetical protein
MKPLLYSATGNVIASEATLEDYRALLADCFGAFAGLRPVGYKGNDAMFVVECQNSIFALIGQGPIEKRFGITMAPKAQQTIAGES